MANKLLTVQQAAGRLGVTDRHIRRMCEAGELLGAARQGRTWLIPHTAHESFRASMPRGSAEQLKTVPAKKREQALQRLGLIGQFEEFAAAFMADGNNGRKEAIEIFTSSNDIAKRTFQRWLSQYRQAGIMGLVDSRGGGCVNSFSPEAIEYFKSLYLTQQRRSVKQCVSDLHYINTTQQMNWQIPSVRFVQMFVNKNIPQAVRVLHREGVAAYEAKCAPYIQYDPDSVEPGQIWIGDHHQFNCWIWHRGKWMRPWITAWQDMRSRALVGWDITCNPNQTTILTAFKMAAEKYGPPDSVKIDNGRDYDSELWTGTTKARRRQLNAGYIDQPMVAGLYAMLDVGCSFAKPYHPQAKAIERMFDTVDMQFTNSFETYCGKDSSRKPDYLNDLLKTDRAKNKAYDLAGFNAVFEKYAQVYNSSAHTGVGMDGSSPDEIMARRQSVRAVAEGVLDLLCRVWSGELKVGKNGVKFNKMWYGQYDMDLAAWQGKMVRVAYDPHDLRQVYVYDAATLKLITVAEQAQLIAYGQAVAEDDLREASRQKSRAHRIAKQFKDSSLTRNMDLTTLTIRAMQDGAKEQPKPEPVRRLRPVRTAIDAAEVLRHQKIEVTKQVKKAAGMEGTTQVLDLNFDAMRPAAKKVPVLWNNDE